MYDAMYGAMRQSVYNIVCMVTQLIKDIVSTTQTIVISCRFISSLLPAGLTADYTTATQKKNTTVLRRCRARAVPKAMPLRTG